jgi:hypothetical protein
VKFASLFRRLLEADCAAAKREFDQWDRSCSFFVPLTIWALAKPAIATAREVGISLKNFDDQIFWDPSYARELLWTIRARWENLSSRDRKALESRLINGRKKYDSESEANFRERRAALSAERLVWMQEAGLHLGPSTVARIPALKTADPHWQDNRAKSADRSLEGRSGWVNRDTDTTPIANIPISEIVARCDALSEREFQSFTDRDPFSGLVEASPKRAMAVLEHEARRGNYPRRYWSRLLSAWPKTSTPRRLVLLAEALTRIPASDLLCVRYELTLWLQNHFAQIDTFSRSTAHSCFDHIVEALEQGDAEMRRSGVGKSSVGGVEIPSNMMGVNFAINSPSGNLAQTLMDSLFSRKPGRNDHIPADLKGRIERLLNLPDEGGIHALTIVARQLSGLYLINRKWSRAVLLPRFDPSDDAAEAAWSGFLASTSMPGPALFREFKHNFIEAIAASPNWNCPELPIFGEMLVLALEAPPRLRMHFSAAEARDALKRANPEIRERTIFFLRNRIQQANAWDRLIVPFFRKVWPRERGFQTSNTTRTLVLFLQDLGMNFPQGVALVADFLVPCGEIDTFVFQFSHDGDFGHADLTTQFPHEVLLLMSKIIDQTSSRAPYGLAIVLTRLAEVTPELRHDDRWRRLHRLTLI